MSKLIAFKLAGGDSGLLQAEKYLIKKPIKLCQFKYLLFQLDHQKALLNINIEKKLF